MDPCRRVRACNLKAEALAAFDRIVGLDLDDVALDGSLHKAPYGCRQPAPNPTDRAKLGWKWSVASERHGIPVGWADRRRQPQRRRDCLSPPSTPSTPQGGSTRSGPCISTGAMTRARCVIDCGPGAPPSSRSSAVARRSRSEEAAFGWGCGGSSRPPTPGGRTTANSEETPIGAPDIATLRSASRQPC